MAMMPRGAFSCPSCNLSVIRLKETNSETMYRSFNESGYALPVDGRM